MSSPRPRPGHGVIERYRSFLPVGPETPIVTLGEGSTPLIPCPALGRAIHPGPGIHLYLKYEGVNPTGSFKDRGMTMAISKAVEAKSTAVICASTGNTSASAAAYGARAGLRVYVVVPEGKIALGKLAQAMVHKATVVQVDGNFDEALQLVREVSDRYPVTLVNSLNPYRLEGQKTAAFEICDELGRAPAFHFLPVGNAGNITAYWTGYKEYRAAGRTEGLPRMMGFQAAGAAPIVLGHVVEKPRTIATAIRIGNPAGWKGALTAAEESRGEINLVTDEEILEAYRMIASLEGIFCEPASAAAVAGMLKIGRQGGFQDGDLVVGTLTGHGLKDADLAISTSQKPVTIKAAVAEIVKVLGY